MHTHPHDRLISAMQNGHASPGVVGALMPTVGVAEGQKILIRPTLDNVLVQRPGDERDYKGIAVPFADRMPIQWGKVLAVGKNVRGIKAGQHVLHLRSIGRRVQAREVTSSESKLWFMQEREALLVIDDELGLMAVHGRIIVEMPEAPRVLASDLAGKPTDNKIKLVKKDDSLSVVLSRVKSVGPDCREVKVGDLVLHHGIDPMPLNDPWVRDRFGWNLGLLHSEELCRAIVDLDAGEQVPQVEGHGFATGYNPK